MVTKLVFNTHYIYIWWLSTYFTLFSFNINIIFKFWFFEFFNILKNHVLNISRFKKYPFGIICNFVLNLFIIQQYAFIRNAGILFSGMKPWNPVREIIYVLIIRTPPIHITWLEGVKHFLILKIDRIKPSALNSYLFEGITHRIR